MHRHYITYIGNLELETRPHLSRFFFSKYIPIRWISELGVRYLSVQRHHSLEGSSGNKENAICRRWWPVLLSLPIFQQRHPLKEFVWTIRADDAGRRTTWPPASTTLKKALLPCRSTSLLAVHRPVSHQNAKYKKKLFSNTPVSVTHSPRMLSVQLVLPATVW